MVSNNVQSATAPLAARMPLSAHLRAVLVLGVPLIGSNVAQMALHVTDTVMLGWYGVNELAAGVLGAGVFFIMFLLGTGFAFAVMGRVSAALGAGDETQMRRDTRMGLWLSGLFALCAFPVFWFSGALLRLLGQEPHLAAMAEDYLRIAWLGLGPALVIATLKSFLAAQERAQVVLWITLIGVGQNIVLNWVLIFGNWGAPELGLSGAAIASVAVSVTGAVLAALYSALAPDLRHLALFQRFWRLDREAFWSVARMGVPIGLTSVFEASMFQASAIMMGWIGVMELAAHGIALELGAMTFMVHMGLSHAATVRTGRAHGAGDIERVRTGALAAQLLSVCFGLLTVAVFLLWPGFLVGLFLDQGNPAAPAILAIGVQLLVMAALFQIFDSLQVMAIGLLRGVQDTRLPMWITLAAYWALGVPASYLFAFTFGWGPEGLWIGLMVGLGAAGGALCWRFWTGPWLEGARV